VNIGTVCDELLNDFEMPFACSLINSSVIIRPNFVNICTRHNQPRNHVVVSRAARNERVVNKRHAIYVYTGLK
jgi:hypothetical protein